MKVENNIQKPIIEQIYDEMIEIIKKKGKFSEKDILNLKNIAYNDSFRSEKAVIEVIKSNEIVKI